MKAIFFSIVCLMLAIAPPASGQTGAISIPAYSDKYTSYVRKLENGQTAIDYTDFRNSFLQSKQYANKHRAEYDSLKKLVWSAASGNRFDEVIKSAQAMLSIDYTSMLAHKYLQQTYKVLGDTANRNKYHDIEFGLLNSIMRSGDGKSCETGWHVTQIEEEYFILNVMGVAIRQQGISEGGDNICDRLEGTTEEGKEQEYYFEANKVFEMERKMFEGK